MFDEEFWASEYSETFELIISLFTTAAGVGAAAVFSTLGQIGLGVDEATVVKEIWEWAKRYAAIRATSITQTTREAVDSVFSAWDGEDLERLKEGLAPIFGSDRAQTIGVSETTLGFSIGNLLAWSAYGIIGMVVWITAEDERVCPICRERHLTEYPIDEAIYGGKSPPAHPRCRCWMEAVLSLSKREARPILNGLFSGKIGWDQVELIARVVT